MENSNHVRMSLQDIADISDVKQGTGGKVGFRLPMSKFFEKAKKRAKFSNPIAPNAADIVNWIIYDRFTVAAATAIGAKFTYFNQPIGTNNKTKSDTNMDQVMRLPDPLWMNVVGVGFYFASNTVKADIDTLLNFYYQEFWVGQKVYVEGPVQIFPGAAGLQGVSTQNNVGVFTNGQARANNFYDLRLPAGIHLGTDPNTQGPLVSDGLMGVTILQGQGFKVDVISGTGSQNTAAAPAVGIQLSCYLYGILSRGVQ